MEFIKFVHAEKKFEYCGMALLDVSIDAPVFGEGGTVMRRVNAYYRHWSSLILRKAETAFMPGCIRLLENEGPPRSPTGCFLLEAEGLAAFAGDETLLSVTRRISFNGRSSITTDVWDAQSGWLVVPEKRRRRETAQIPETALASLRKSSGY